jgi:AcrR family transcriptional regulator
MPLLALVSVKSAPYSDTQALSSANVQAVVDIDDLLDNPKSLTRYRVLRAARPLLATRGLAVSMDDIAEAAGVSRRSLFRHFESRDALVAAALESTIDNFDNELTDALAADGDMHDWLSAIARRSFMVQLTAGLGYWQLASATDDELPSELAAVNRRRRETRQQLTTVMAQTAWRRAGGRTRCPTIVADAVALTISTFTTQSLLADYDIGVDRAVELVATVLNAAINRELAPEPQPAKRHG